MFLFWFNDGKGGISYKEKGNQVDIKIYSGSCIF